MKNPPIEMKMRNKNQINYSFINERRHIIEEI
jgi:hypothetical protein